MAQLFGRRAVLTVGTVKIDTGTIREVGAGSLDFAFNVQKSLGRSANKAEINIWNLSKDHRSALSALRKVPVKLEAGYDDGTGEGRVPLLFRGDLREVSHERDGPNIITTISGKDGGRAVKHATANLSFGKGAGIGEVMEGLVNALTSSGNGSVGRGNFDKVKSDLQFEGVANAFQGGASFIGNAWDEIVKVTQGAGKEVSIQSGKLQFTNRGAPAVNQSVLLSSSTGLIGTPQRSAKGVIEAVALIIPGIFPGAKVTLDAENIQGVFRVIEASYAGDTAAESWFINVKAREI